MVGVVISFMRQPLIELGVKQCPQLNKKPEYITNKDLRKLKVAATKELKDKMGVDAPAPPPVTT
jgi:hypothetical protein